MNGNVYLILFFIVFICGSIFYTYAVYKKNIKTTLFLICYITFTLLLSDIMFNLKNYLYSSGYVIDVGHASWGIVITFFSFCILALIIIIVSLFIK